MATETLNGNRRLYQAQVERLLDQIRDGVQDLRLLKAIGARGPVLAERKSNLDRARRRLARLVGAPARR
jgi:hypothetical protein